MLYLQIRIKSLHLIGWSLFTWPLLFRDTDWGEYLDRSIAAFISHYKLSSIQTFAVVNSNGVGMITHRKTQEGIETTCTNRNFTKVPSMIKNLHLSVPNRFLDSLKKKHSFFWYLFHMWHVEFGKLGANPVHFLLTENIKRGNQGIIVKCYYLIQNIFDGIMRFFCKRSTILMQCNKI